MAFCPSCGSQVEGNFCPKCGSSVTGGPVAGAGIPSSGPSAGPAAAGMTDNVAGALAYIPIIGIIFLLIDPYKTNRGIRFHAFQGLFLLACVIVVNILTGIVVGFSLGFLFLYSLIRLAFAVVWIYCMYQAFTGKKVVLPVIGPIAEKQA
jgi:uncharacterized membrane protein